MLLLAGCAWVTDQDVKDAIDGDGDGVTDVRWGGRDCDDQDGDVHPGADERCNDVDDDCDGQTDEDPVDAPGFADVDGDGHGDAGAPACAGGVATGDDCDDVHADAYPGAVEGCDGYDNDCDGAIDDVEGTQTVYPDADADGWGGEPVEAEGCPDGYIDVGGDCDDADATVNPAAEEVCDFVDDDCDGRTDDADDTVGGTATWFFDGDEDGFGDPDVSDDACDRPGWVANDEDCDDGDAAVHPGADEHCDGVDEDCDEATDDDPVDPGTFYADADADGYGDANTATEACDVPDGYSADATDCDDADGAIHPGAAEDCASGVDSNCDGATGTVDGDGDGAIACDDCDDGDADVFPGAAETCDGVDDDCDGLTDDDDPGVSGRATWYPDADGDGFGDPFAGAPACDPPAGSLADATDCDDARAEVNPDARERCDDALDRDCDGVDDDCEPTLSDADAILRGVSAGDAAGTALAGLGDVDGDGLEDLAVGAPGAGGAGAAYLVLAPASGTLTLSSADATWTGASGDDAGSALCGPGDTDLGGVPDLVVGAPGGDTVGVLFDPSGGGRLAAADLLVTASTSGVGFGTALAGGSLDGDYFPDVAVGAPGTDAFLANDAGAVYLFDAPLVAGTDDETDADVTIASSTAGRALGRALAAGDANGDGEDDLFVSGVADTLWSTGGVYLFDQPTGVLSEGDAFATIDADTSGDDAGAAIAAGADFDGDGYEDVLVGAPDASGEGIAYLVLGPITADVDLGTADAKLTGTASGDEAGAAVAFAGDLDGDGLSEVLVGAPGAPAAYLVFGTASPAGTQPLADAAVRWQPETSADEAGAALAGTGDALALIGAPGWGSGKGSAYAIGGY